jgi:hypothetical protein
LAQAFGIITPDEASDFHRIKAIRNVFAHARVNITFDTDAIATELDDCIAYKKAKSHLEGSKYAEALTMFSERKRIFLYMVQCRCIIIDFAQKEFTGSLMGEYGKHD